MKHIKHTTLAATLALLLPLGAQAVEFGIFADVTASDTTNAGDNPGFALGMLDFYATQAISERSRGFVELVFENGPDGMVTDLERLWVSYAVDTRLNLAAGRFHSPLGQWNRRYHHGAILQDTVSRPFFLDYEDGSSAVLPLHIVGLMANGELESEGGTFSYEFAVANGPSIDTSNGYHPAAEVKPEIDINVASDPNRDKSLLARLVYQPMSLPLEFGAFGMRNVVADSASSGNIEGGRYGDPLVEQMVYGLDAAAELGRLELLGEIYRFRNKNRVGVPGSYDATAYYLQVGARVHERFKLVGRYANLDFDENDSYFRLLGTERMDRLVAGVRFDLDEASTVKFELSRSRPEEHADYTTYFVQWAFIIP